MLRTLSLLLVLVCAGGTFAGDEPRLLPGERLDGVERAVLEIADAGTYTLGRSHGALVLGAQRSEDGWLIAELAAGPHTVELPGGPGDVTALAGKVEAATADTFLNRAKGHVNASELQAAWDTLLAARARPASASTDAEARMFQGGLLRRAGRPAEARELLLGAREAVVAAGNADIEAYLVDNLGQAALALEDWDVAQQCFERLRELLTDPGEKALAISRLAQVAAARRDHERARALHEEALATLTDTTQAAYVSIVTFGAGQYYQERADFARAAELLRRAADTAQRWDQQVAALGQLGVVEMVRGRLGAAMGLLDQVDALAAEHSPSHYDAVVLRNRAALAFSLGEFGVARERLERLLTLVDDADERDGIGADLALLSWMQDDEPGALKRYGEVLEHTSETSRARWRALNGKAALLFAEDRPMDAAPLAQDALTLAKGLGDAYLSAVSLMAMSEASCRLGAPETARAQAEAAVASLQEQDARDLLLPAWHALARAALLQGDEATVTDLLQRAWAESMRGETAALPSLQAAQIRSRVSDLSDWGGVAADLAARCATRASDAAGGAGASLATEALAAAWRRTTQWRARTLVADLQGNGDVPEDLGARLSTVLAGRTLVEYAAGDERLYAFIMEGGALRFVDLGPRRPIDALVQTFLHGLDNSARLATAADVARVGGQLYDRLLRPLALAGGSVIIVPCGDLARLPFEALVVSAPEGVKRFDQIAFVLDSMDVGYAPSSAALAVLAARPPLAQARGALLLGDPTYALERSPDLVAARGEAATRWERLPHTRDELSRVARLLLTLQKGEGVKDALYELTLLERTRDVSLSTTAFDLRLGGPASVESLRTLAPQARFIHLAAHAQVDRWDTRRTGLLLSWEDADQGLFSLADIAGLELDADLVVLSACRTADGRLLNGEGVQSIAGAFLAAGARGVVATLWAVTDAQAQDLMEGFATHYLADGESPESALRHAKRDVRAASVRGAALTTERPERPAGHPYHWAPFLFTGATAARAR